MVQACPQVSSIIVGYTHKPAGIPFKMSLFFIQNGILKLTGRRISIHTVPVSAHTHNPQGFLEISVIP